MAKVYALIHEAIEVPGLLGEMLEEQGHTVSEIHLYRGELAPDSPQDAKALVVMGGPMGVYDEDIYPFLKSEKDLIRSFIDKGLPVIGICLGSQLIASALGANVYPSGGKEIGWYDVTCLEGAKSDPLFSQLPSKFCALHWHGDIFDLPEGAISLARTELTKCQAYRYRESVYGILFHFEVTEKVANNFVSEFADELSEAGLSGTRILADTETHLPSLSPLSRRLFSRWIEMIPRG